MCIQLEWRHSALLPIGLIHESLHDVKASPLHRYFNTPKYMKDICMISSCNSYSCSVSNTNTGDPVVIIGGGHAASIAVRCVSKGLIKALAIAAVAPTWSGPLPIVFGRSATMETRYVPTLTLSAGRNILAFSATSRILIDIAMDRDLFTVL